MTSFGVRRLIVSRSISGIVCALLSYANAAYARDDAHYFPAVVGPPSGTLRGRLIDLGFGNGSGALTILSAAGKKIDLYTASPPFVVDGVAIACPLAPRRGFVPTHDECPSWPPRLVVGRSRVIVPFWRGMRYGKPTLIARGFRMVRD